MNALGVLAFIGLVIVSYAGRFMSIGLSHRTSKPSERRARRAARRRGW